MKLRYFIPIVVALVAMFTGCTSDDDPIYLGNIQVSSSYVSLSKDGGTTAVELNTAGDWSVDESTVPAWLTISPMSGAAGAVTQNYSAEAVNATRKATIKLNCGGQTQEINVIQFAVEADPEIMTVSEAVAMIKAGTAPEGAAYVKGIVCKIQEISPSYGNATFFLSDDGSYGADNWLEVYRGKWLNGENFTKGDEFSVGDELTIKGVLTYYNNSVPETVQGTAEVVAISKSLIKVDSLDVTELPIEGGVTTAALSCKGDGISVEVPADAQSWLSVIGIDTNQGLVKLMAQPNAGGDRQTTVTFKTTSNGKEYSATAVVAQKGAILEVPVSDFLAAAVGDTQYRLTGVISKVAKAEYGNIYIKDYTGEAYVYGIGAKGDFEKLGLKEGDIVTLVGKRAAYKDSPQMSGGQYESHISVTDISIADFLAAADSKDVYYRVSGTIDEIANDTYGNLYINDGAGNRLYVYGCYPGYGAKGDARKGFLGTAGIKVGDKLTMIGYKDTYNGTIELCGGIYFSHEAAE